MSNFVFLILFFASISLYSFIFFQFNTKWSKTVPYPPTIQFLNIQFFFLWGDFNCSYRFLPGIIYHFFCVLYLNSTYIVLVLKHSTYISCWGLHITGKTLVGNVSKLVFNVSDLMVLVESLSVCLMVITNYCFTVPQYFFP